MRYIKIKTFNNKTIIIKTLDFDVCRTWCIFYNIAMP